MGHIRSIKQATCDNRAAVKIEFLFTPSMRGKPDAYRKSYVVCIIYYNSLNKKWQVNNKQSSNCVQGSAPAKVTSAPVLCEIIKVESDVAKPTDPTFVKYFASNWG